jgi:hypothetical protein
MIGYQWLFDKYDGMIIWDYHIMVRLYGFPFAKIRIISVADKQLDLEKNLCHLLSCWFAYYT